MSIEGPRDGGTFDPGRDLKPLNDQSVRVWAVMSDENWHTLADLETKTGDPQSSISARLRDFRKKKFGKHVVLRSRDAHSRQWHYKLVWNVFVTRPTQDRVNEAWYKRRGSVPSGP